LSIAGHLKFAAGQV